jgi:glycosyltransferase involved in cell wall biosynthesis
MNDQPRAPRALFLGSLYAGHRTRFENLRAHTRDDPRLRSTYAAVSGWREDGLFERLPGVPAAVKGRMRGTWEAAAFARFPRPDVIWSAATEVLTPHLWAQLGPLRRPLILDLDSTALQLEEMAPVYFGRPPKGGLVRRVLLAREQLLVRRVTLFTPRSRWAADGLRAMGVQDNRIAVLPPGVDLDQWKPAGRDVTGEAGPLRLLFVGGDFRRKGGDLLVDLVSGPLAGRCELDIVTRDPVELRPGIRVHRAEANSPALRALYAQADVFVLPTRAECFGIATVEAMASGLPAIMSNVGGAEDIVEPGRTGWLIQPSETDLLAAIEAALSDRCRLRAMGVQARQVAEQRFDGVRNDRRVVDLMVELAECRR